MAPEVSLWRARDLERSINCGWMVTYSSADILTSNNAADPPGPYDVKLGVTISGDKLSATPGCSRFGELLRPDYTRWLHPRRGDSSLAAEARSHVMRDIRGQFVRKPTRSSIQPIATSNCWTCSSSVEVSVAIAVRSREYSTDTGSPKRIVACLLPRTVAE